jgi:hypothetical protein
MLVDQLGLIELQMLSDSGRDSFLINSPPQLISDPLASAEKNANL